MTLLLDAAPLVALADRRDRARPLVEEVLTTFPGPLVLPAPVTAGVDYLLEVLTFDQRHFGAVAPLGDRASRLLPAER